MKNAGGKRYSVCWNSGSVHTDVGSFQHEDFLLGYFRQLTFSCMMAPFGVLVRV